MVGGSAPPVHCRVCDAVLERTVVDLGELPLANEFLADAAASIAQPRFPLRLRVCERCFLVQIDETVPPERLFGDYIYFSSYSDSWVEHARRFAVWAVDALDLDRDSLVVEVASNDGYMLQHFAERAIPILGIEPAANVAEAATERGIRTLVDYLTRDLGERLAADGVRADLVIANNVFAHVPDPRDLLAGMAAILAPTGLLTIEVPHVLRLLEQVQFDTIYHEHYSYFSLRVVDRLAESVGLEVVEVEAVPTHGGSMRMHLRHRTTDARREPNGADAARREEAAAGLERIEVYDTFSARVKHAVSSLNDFVAAATAAGDGVCGYGAAAKGTVLLNAARLGADRIEVVGDLSPHKIGRFVPGLAIPIVAPEALLEKRPRHVLVLAWNLLGEIMEQLQLITEWGGDFVTAIPEVRVHR